MRLLSINISDSNYVVLVKTLRRLEVYATKCLRPGLSRLVLTEIFVCSFRSGSG